MAQVGHPLKAQASFRETVQGQQFGGFPQQRQAFRGRGAQGKVVHLALAEGGGGEAGHLAAEARPFEQLQGLRLDGVPLDALPHAGPLG